jgi:hypothetical protein
MSPRIVRLAMLAYPRRWRCRYGAELEELTIAVLAPSQPLNRKLGVLVDLVSRGVDERVRRTESRGMKAVLTSGASLLAGMALLAGGLASDAVHVSNVQLSARVRLGPGVSLVRADRLGTSSTFASRGVAVIVSTGRNPQVSVGGGSAVVINTRSGLVTSVTRAAGVR